MKTKAVALKYDKEKNQAPLVSAKGEGKTAQKIIQLAKENGVPLKKDEDLVELLSKVELDKEIPPQMYQAIAEVFSFVYSVTREKS
ncbi:EscU/YscU/HrcU family type III secretion system export apparatus switch protein [Sulfurimonas sp. SWIR-19]|uniref:EscU/YscU/HrcU family type III secretion system export apparatus switch protein n=1 Tax=Sulfurimonas sp. SWIR-19 TaxID=2878390 RepID=UPI001CF36F01|nr:EscU/YscU/HrcU family type III secretion system export apparatus switch protein [Sulfurimonas sp. SWIR-19]UCN01279.1 EscU/YscU/HrcU family type III secretion system export apparatus switch protein [Sulfurimonas sp. SWIR-19]